MKTEGVMTIWKFKKKKNKKYTQAWDPAGNKISGL